LILRSPLKLATPIFSPRHKGVVGSRGLIRRTIHDTEGRGLPTVARFPCSKDRKGKPGRVSILHGSKDSEMWSHEAQSTTYESCTFGGSPPAHVFSFELSEKLGPSVPAAIKLTRELTSPTISFQPSERVVTSQVTW